MQAISFTQQPVRVSTYTSKRQEIIDSMLKTINESREGTKYKPCTFRQINGMLRNVKDWDLDIFYASFKNAKTPSAFFFWKIKELSTKKS